MNIVRDQAEKNKIYFDKNFTEEKYFENFDRYIEWLTKKKCNSICLQ